MAAAGPRQAVMAVAPAEEETAAGLAAKRIQVRHCLEALYEFAPSSPAVAAATNLQPKQLLKVVAGRSMIRQFGDCWSGTDLAPTANMQVAYSVWRPRKFAVCETLDVVNGWTWQIPAEQCILHWITTCWQEASPAEVPSVHADGAEKRETDECPLTNSGATCRKPAGAV